MLQFILVLLTENACSFLAFLDKVVGGRQLVEPVALDVGFALFYIDSVVALEELKDGLVDGDGVRSNDYSWLFVGRYLVVPGVVANVLNRVPQGGVGIQDLRDEILGVVAEEAREFVVSFEDLLIKFFCILVFEG